MPIRMESTTIANCRPDHVWDTFGDTTTWPQWNQVIGTADWDGAPWQSGSRLRLQIVNPVSLSLAPTVQSCEPPGWVHLTGSGMGTQAQLAFSFEPQENGTTLLRARSEVSGPATFLVSERMKSDIKRVFDLWMEALKAQSERLAQQEARQLSVAPTTEEPFSDPSSGVGDLREQSSKDSGGEPEDIR